MPKYDSDFYDYTNSISRISAENIVALIKKHISVDSVLDVGCAEGIWLSAWQRSGITDFIGLDGDYVESDRLQIDAGHFVVADLSKNFDQKRSFDLVQSLEVAEHLPGNSADGFVKCLTGHADIVLFSAAPPGQGGRNHINEQSYDYWRRRFANNGFIALDCLRPLIGDNNEIAPWYRYNTFLYVRDSALDRLPAAWLERRLSDNRPVPDISPMAYKIRKLLVRALPEFVKNKLAILAAWLRNRQADIN